MRVVQGEIQKGDKSELDAWLDKIQFLSDSMESTSQPFGVGHPDGRLLICNNAFCQLTGYSREELLNNVNWSADLTPPEWRGHEIGMLRELQKTGKPQRYEKEYIRKDGTRVPVELFVHPAQDTAGNTLFYYSFVTNITERKRAEGALLESEADLARSQAIAHLGSWELEVSTGRVRGSEELYRMFNLRPDVTLEAYIEKMHPEDRVWVVESIAAAINEGKPYDIDYRIVPHHGDARYVHAEGEVTRDKNGLAVKFFGTVLDITDRKQAEVELCKARDEMEMRVRERTLELEKANVDLERQVRERLRSEKALQASEEGLQRANRALKMLSRCKEAMIRSEDESMLLNDICHIIVNEGGYRLAWIGYIEDDEARTVRPVARAGYDEGYVDSLKIALNDPVRGSGPTGISLRTGRPYGSRNVGADVEMQPWRQDALRRGYLSTLNLPVIYESQTLGTLVIYSSRAGAFEGEELKLLEGLADNLAYGVKAIRDRVRRDRAEKELMRARDELEARVRARTGELRQAKVQAELYLDLLSHDINNLNMIALGYLEMAQEALDLKDEDKELIERPYESLLRSTALIDNVGKLQRIAEGDMMDETLELGSLLSEVASVFGKQGATIRISQGATGPCYVRANQLLQDAFSNLLSNAIKHSKMNCPDIFIRLEATVADGKKMYKVSVEDNGPGVPDEMKEKIFNRLQRGNTRARGMGLGLYLVKSLVDSYQGRVWVEDRVPGDHKKGSKFVVILPAI